LLIPNALRGARDLTPLPVRSLDEIVNQYRQLNPAAIASYIDVTVTR
jgi:hypothetical protein